ncbi:NAD-glutamate dehydrogenase [Oricola cellulosilytica]|uniref:NAD-glutamate dehydrogenase n=1 Tax=Oricola cellulosilytica TaxID=1429082 RepID=A0A4R0PA98_9HYPH|nr:NAD-glutamate dehydrogenase [Oricola cellulosilytica]TCD13855.1 NAD-glutamate dehydrogenase [Oricola cellulosilytica]
MAKSASASVKRYVSAVVDRFEGSDERIKELASALLGEAHPEDLAVLDPATARAAIAKTADALAHHRHGASEVHVEPVGEDDWCVVSIVNENMPFLFDSVLGEINDLSHNVALVVHPILDVKHQNGNFEIVDKSRPGLAREDTIRTSVIHVLLRDMSPAEANTLEENLKDIISQVKSAVRDWKPMLGRLDEVMEELRTGILPVRKSDANEALAFLEWLRDNNFTLLGIREYKYRGGEARGQLVRADKPGLGILSDPDVRVMRRGDEPVTTTAEIRAFLNSRDLLIVTKANIKSKVHRRSYMDYIGIKRYDAKGKLAGELRVVGLFTSTAYTRSVTRIPYIRSKTEAVIRRSEFEPDSHSGKALQNVLESYPRDELFQIDVPTLTRNALAIVALADRPRVRVLSRIDAFDRFVSVIVFLPRERYSSSVREGVGNYLAKAYKGHISAYYPAFPEGALARVHFIVGRREGKTPTPTQASLEADILAITRTWEDHFQEAVTASIVDAETRQMRDAGFPETYRDTVSPEQAVADLKRIAKLSPRNPIEVDFYHPEGTSGKEAGLRIYHYGAPVALSERVPILENMGFRVISELTYAIDVTARLGNVVWLHDMKLQSGSGKLVPLDDGGAIFEDAFLSVWTGGSDNDTYNGLVLAAGLTSMQVTVLRAFGRYLRQTGMPYGQVYMADALIRHPLLARQLYDLFEAVFDPVRHADPEEDTAVTAKHIRAAIADQLADVPSIDDDRILRSIFTVIDATLRTNYFNSAVGGAPRSSLAFKFDPRAIPELPDPKPYREIFVFGPEVEGVHLRFGPIARGGLRWSDRPQDYRTEVLGLVKAQQVKNAVIVPVGAKGGFYPKRLPQGGTRDEVFEAGRAAYITFISSLLSITDTLEGDAVVPPRATVRLDGDDPYFVVAADKGTATFSDTANAISQEMGFWLDDAFASGGSAGYDHKKMGITARGAWEAVKRHFREMNKDIQSEPFTVIGVGDMSGDVFGNGMLLSEKIKLIAAFDHRDIFIDPDPDPEASFAERKRMFALGRSSWQDYDTSKLSKGGGIFPRSQKTITLSKAAAAAIGLEKTRAAPNEILTSILKADVELLWFGGIGTYVRASSETNADAGDKANDAIRITAREVGAKVVGEGANLGLTQRARIEYGLHGGRCNSDAIDNSAGVNSSDLEVNIKIALKPAMDDGTLPRKERDKLLAEMTEKVADLVLENNYLQTLAISLAERRAYANLALQERLMESLEDRGLLDRKVEFLPDEEMLTERRKAGLGLTRAEIGVLLAYAKIVLFDDIVRSPLPDDPHLKSDLINYFPPRMTGIFAERIEGHRLRREIISTVLANEAINRGGPTLISRFEDATGMLPSGIVRAHVAVRDSYGIEPLYAAVDALDTKIDGNRQLEIYDDIANSQRIAIGQFIKNGDSNARLDNVVAELGAAARLLEPKLLSIIPEYQSNWVRGRRDTLKADGLAEAVARKIAVLPILAMTPDITSVGKASARPVIEGAEAFYAVTELFQIGRLEHLAHSLSTDDYFDGLAQNRALDILHAARLAITNAALSAVTPNVSADEAVAAWHAANELRIRRVQGRIKDLTTSGDLTVSRLTVAAGLLADIVS